jgi:hypothetical protein
MDEDFMNRLKDLTGDEDTSETGTEDVEDAS